ncbi:hypothetical protein B0H14DRAFT_3561472 [Mycena olivaceomarginata]|nr:hypothetical protein B0H14DRAFT_3561472 [Mycena olivaceomarginata]
MQIRSKDGAVPFWVAVSGYLTVFSPKSNIVHTRHCQAFSIQTKRPSLLENIRRKLCPCSGYKSPSRFVRPRNDTTSNYLPAYKSGLTWTLRRLKDIASTGLPGTTQTIQRAPKTRCPDARLSKLPRMDPKFQPGATEEAAVQTFPSKTPDAAAARVKCGISPVSRYLYGLSEVIQGRLTGNQGPIIHGLSARGLSRRRQSRDQRVSNMATHKSGHGDPSPDQLLCSDKKSESQVLRRICSKLSPAVCGRPDRAAARCGNGATFGHEGAAIVCLERMGENEALQLRVLEPLHDFHERILHGYGEPRRLPDPVLEDYLPKFRHLPPLRAGDLLPDPASKRAEPFVWRYSNDAVPNRDAALHCLPPPHERFPVPEGTGDPATYESGWGFKPEPVREPEHSSLRPART